jgi:hypothetical protein
MNDYSNTKLLINEIFLKNTNGKFSNLIKNTQHIPTLLSFLLNTGKEEQVIFPLNTQLETINFLNLNFKQLPQNQEIFLKHSIKVDDLDIRDCKYNIFHVLISIFLNSEIDTGLYVSIKDCLEGLVNTVNCNKEVFEFVYQKLAKLYRNPTVDKSVVEKFLVIFKILYGEGLNYAKPGNYFYFSGNGAIRVDDKRLAEDKLKLDAGITISLWFKIDLAESTDLSNMCDLIVLKTSKDTKIQISLYVNKLIIRNYSEKEFEYRFENDWNNLSLIVRPKSYNRDTEFILLINEGKFMKKYSIHKFDTNCEITEISFYQNFIGQAGSIIVLNKAITDDYVKLLTNTHDNGINNYGIFNEKKLIRFIRYCNNKYMLCSNLKTDKTIKDNEGLSHIYEHMKIFYVPFRANDKVIYDIMSKYNASFVSLDCVNGVHLYNCFQKNIFFIGGINNLLPLVEFMHTHCLICDRSLCTLFELIFSILNYRLKNMKDAVNKNFFQMLSLFIEKFDKATFTEIVLEKLLFIGRSLFAFVDQCELSIIYFDYILLNERVFTKFSIELQRNLWSSLYQFYVSDISQIKNFMKMSKICLIVKYRVNDLVTIL